MPPESTAMDLAQRLIRSVTRAFYDPRVLDTRHIVIVDALVVHNALRDDDLSYLMSMNLKDLHRICARLREDRFLQVHVRPELKDGQQRPTNRTYYYIDYRQAIDAIKWRVYQIDKQVQGNAKPAAEKKEYFCTRCKAEWTQMEVLDKMDPMRGFLCHRCDNVLKQDPEREAGGHEQSTRLNNQLRFITETLPKLDAVVIPDNTFEVAYANRRPVVRDAQNQVVHSEPVLDLAKPTAVKGMANTGPQSIAIDITDSEGPTEAEKEAERERKEKIAQANALPSWHVTSTVTGASYGGNNPIPAAAKEEEDEKKPAELVDDSVDNEEMANLFSMLKAQQEEEAKRKEAEQDSDDEEDDDEEEEEFEDITNNASSFGDKRHQSSGTTSAADTPASEERPPKKVKVEEPVNDADSDEEEVAFEDV